MNRQKRYDLQVPILLPTQLAGMTVDLGERGLGFVSNQRLKPGEQLQIRVMLPTARPFGAVQLPGLSIRRTGRSLSTACPQAEARSDLAAARTA